MSRLSNNLKNKMSEDLIEMLVRLHCNTLTFTVVTLNGPGPFLRQAKQVYYQSATLHSSSSVTRPNDSINRCVSVDRAQI